MDATTSFQYLVDSLPSWTDRINKLSDHSIQKHEEFKAEYTRLVKKATPRRMKSSSICSIHTDDEVDPQDVEPQQDSTAQSPNLIEISPFEAGNRYIYAQATKKRKPGTSFRSGASGPLKFRGKHMVVIYYDSYVQSQLDTLVKSIGASRNNLRKGKMAYTVAKGLQLPALTRKYDMSPSVPSLDSVKSMSSYRSPKFDIAKTDISMMIEDVPTGEAAFKQADKDLEVCQNLCETAAHQFLRDGDCKLELDTVLRNFEKVSSLAKTTLDSMKAEDEDRARQNSEENDSTSSSVHVDADTPSVPKPLDQVFDVSNKLNPTLETSFNSQRPPVSMFNSAPPVMTEIEVDDATDESSIELDLSNFRSARAANRGGLRT